MTANLNRFLSDNPGTRFNKSCYDRDNLYRDLPNRAPIGSHCGSTGAAIPLRALLFALLLLLILPACGGPESPQTTERLSPTATASERLMPSSSPDPDSFYPPPAEASLAADPDKLGQETLTPMPLCTPPACAAGEVYYCSGDCPGGCGTTCATVTPLPPGRPGTTFAGKSAMDFLRSQMNFGPRYPGSPGHEAVGDYLVRELTALGWDVEVQKVPYQGFTGRNLIARANTAQEEIIILGAHYDTRRIADHSPNAEDRDEPVPGAVDGASGVAVLLELARTLDLEEVPAEIWLAFFDLEDNGSGGIPGWEWIIGSTYMAENLTVEPAAMVLVDMVGDADQQLYYEGNSDPALQARLWQIAAGLGYSAYFIPEYKHTMTDDHVPFARRGIPAVDIIDFDYPYWHTVEDTADKVSADSLLRVGRTLEEWLESELE